MDRRGKRLLGHSKGLRRGQRQTVKAGRAVAEGQEYVAAPLERYCGC